MSHRHTLQPGESLQSLAKHHGFAHWRAIYQHGANASLRARRGAPNRLMPGDVVVIPDKTQAWESCATTQRHRFIMPRSRGIWNLAWTPARGACGDALVLRGETDLAEGTVVAFRTLAREDTARTLPELSARVVGGRVEARWQVRDQWMWRDDRSVIHRLLHLDTSTVDATIACNVAVFELQGLADAPAQTFTATRSWSGFTNHTAFTQSLDGFLARVGVTFNVMKAWGAYWVDLSSVGITGTAGGLPWSGYRWGRATGTNTMAPSQYYDGTTWRALPTGFTLTGTNHSAVGLVRSGTQWVLPDNTAATWPGSFTDYDFNSTHYTQRRAAWTRDTHDRWSDRFHLRRHDCPSALPTRCCRYGVDVTVQFNVVTTWSAGTVTLSAGNLRSNAGNWFMDDSRIEMAAHEAGHHLDNPDEYAGGAVDTTVNGDGAVAGIDAGSLMGQGMTLPKKRHYHAFATMVGRLVSSAYGRTYTYDVVDK